MSYLNIDRKPMIGDIVKITTLVENKITFKKYRVYAVHEEEDIYGNHDLDCININDDYDTHVSSINCVLLNYEQINMFPEVKYVL